MDEQRFGFNSIFGNALTSHRDEELEAHWAAGTLGNIPSIEAVDTSCPKPWGFLRIVGLGVATYLIILFSWNYFHNVNLLPGLIVIGAAVLPVGVMYLFFELNIRRNVSMYLVEKMLLLGGVVSLLFSLFMFKLTDSLGLGFLGASVAGIAEEIGKLLAVIAVVRCSRYPYILNGLLFGAAVGAGFAFLETAGYALDALVENVLRMTVEHFKELAAYQAQKQCSVSELLSKAFTLFATLDDSMVSTLSQRGFLAPFGHVVWTAIAGGALWSVKRGRPWQWSMLLNWHFVGPMLSAMLLHGIWNSPLKINLVCAFDKYILLGLIGWGIALYLVRKGLEQVAYEKQLALENAPAEASAEEALRPIIQIQYNYQNFLKTPVESKPEPSRAPRPDDHLELDATMAEVDKRERERQAPTFTDRPWMKYYQDDGKQENADTATPGQASAVQASVPRQNPVAPQGTGTAKRSWRKYYDEKE